VPHFRRAHHLLIQAVIAFSCGIAGAAFYPAAILPLFPLLLLLALPVFFAWRRRHALQLPLLCLFWLVCGLLHGTTALLPPAADHSLYNIFAAGREATLAGTLLQAPVISPDRTRLLLRTEACLIPPDEHTPAGGEGSPAAAPLPSFIPAAGDIELSLKDPPPADLRPGQRLLVRAFVSRPKGFATPGCFDYSKFLAWKSIWVTGWISSPAHIAIVAGAEGDTPGGQWRYYPERLRHQINQFLRTRLAAEHSSLYLAILTGDSSALSPQTLENYRATGAVHLLSISGLHMGLIALGVGAVVNWLLKRSTWLLIHTSAWKTAAIVIMPVLFGYALIAGMQPPVVRSLIMTSVFLLAVLFDRQWHLPTNIAIAAFIILLLHPAALFTVSMQLSFAAVIAMALIMPRLLPAPQPEEERETRRQPTLAARIGAALKGGILLSFAALVGTLPLLVFYFNRFSPLAAVSTLLLEPLLCFWALPWGLLACPFIFFAPETAGLLLDIGAPGLTLADKLCAWLAALPYSSIWLPTPSLLEIACYYALLGSLLYLRRPGDNRGQADAGRKVVFGTALNPAAVTAAASLTTLLLAVAFTAIRQQQRPTDIVSILDVGQGNAAVIELSGGYTALIDGGGPSSPQFNVGERVIAPFLWGRRISRLQALVISHADADHCNGLSFIISRFRPERIWVNGVAGANANHTALLDLATRLGIPVHVPRQGETLIANGQSRIVNVADLHRRDTIADENDKSLTIRVTSHGKNFLLPGDISAAAEGKMVEEHRELAADVLLLPHHGSASSTSAAFLRAVSPDYAVISAGSGGRRLFPDPSVINRCREAGCAIYNTAETGAVLFTVDQGRLAVEVCRLPLTVDGLRKDQSGKPQTGNPPDF
jgi:competence protein ComEC